MTPQAHPRARPYPTDIHLYWTGLVALVLTYLTIRFVLPRMPDTTLARLFTAQGGTWVAALEVLFGIWAAAMLVAKKWKLVVQRRALAADLLPLAAGERITPANAIDFAEQIRLSRHPARGGVLATRISRALDHFLARGRVEDVTAFLREQVDSAAMAADASYVMVKAFIWAIPILGFIGTVLGIGDAVRGFSASIHATELQVAGAAGAEAAGFAMSKVTESLGIVTSGLAFAFDTTLVALVMSVFIMIPMSSLQKNEDDFLLAVEDYCRERLLRRLDDGAL